MSSVRKIFCEWRTGVQYTLRAVVSLLMIASLGLAQFGYPVWKVVAKNGDRPFPCQFSNCGCKTAEQCRTSCCCHTKRERVAWAVQRGIDPDEVAILTLNEKLEFTFAANLAQPKQAESCCQAKAQSSCCSPESAVAVEKGTSELQWVLAITAHRCRGTGVEWIEAGMVAQPPLPVAFVVEPLTACVVSSTQPIYFSVAGDPLLRPV